MNEMPYNEKNWEDQPTEKMKNSAKRFRIAEWRRVNTMDIKEIKTHLAAGLPVIIGAMVSAEFRDYGYTDGANFIWKKKGKKSAGMRCCGGLR